MGTFDLKTNTPGLLRSESLNINIKFDRTGPTTGRVSWNIPIPATGCEAEDQAYCGMLVTIDTTPTSATKLPTDGTVYNSDPTADANLFAGDKLGSSFVVGAFYHNRTTSFFDITGLTPNTPYYVVGFPMDCQFAYFKEGVHSYSLDYTNRGSDGTKASQIVVLNTASTTTGVAPTDFTGLVAGTTYDFKMQIGLVPAPRTPIDPMYCNPSPLTYNFTIDGTNASTYADLLIEINKSIALLDNVVQGPTAPNTGTLYWDSGTLTLYSWNGSANIEVPHIYQSTAPNLVAVGTYWLNPTTDVLQVWNGATWDTPTVITTTYNPLAPTADNSFWFNGTIGYNWNGSTWCARSTILGTSDPSLNVPPLDGAYWYNTVNDTLYKWDNVSNSWIITDMIQYSTNPSTLADNSYWFDESSNILNVWNVPNVGWNVVDNVAISEREPAFPAPGKFWYNPTIQELKQWNNTSSLWVVKEVISYPSDPTIRSTCDLWWNTTLNGMSTWNVLTNSWTTVNNFYEQPNDPAIPEVADENSLWYNTDTNQLYVWMNNCYTLVDFINLPTDPMTTLTPGVIWYNNTTQSWNVLNGSNAWDVIVPVISEEDISNLPIGTYWFNSSDNSLQLWNGASWIAILYTTTNPSPEVGTLWYNSNINKLLLWNGVTWADAPVKALVELDCHGNLIFTDNTVGSTSFIQLTDGNLFGSLSVPYAFHTPKPGTDGTSNVPSYMELGIGTDGNNQLRQVLMNEIRMELGYPIVDVELTNEQLDYAITKTLSELRSKSGLGYKRGFFFMRVQPETQRYILNNKIGEFNKIVDIMGIYRLTSSFLSSAHGAGVYGQIVLQHLYNMGTFDLLSYHIMTEYTKTMEQLFAARLTFTWNEQQRELWIHHRFPMTEPYVSVEASIERTEQDLLSDRYSRPWIRRYAAAQARLMLAEVRGKYSSLPGASGSITLNANDLRMAAKEEMENCLQEIEDFVADSPDQYGMASSFIFG